MNPTSRILIAGIGNIFCGDDGFGVELAQRLLARPWPDGVRIVDFGIRGLDLTYALLDGYDAAILLDAAPTGQSLGTVSVIQPQLDTPSVAAPEDVMIDPHNLDSARVLRVVRQLGGHWGQVFLVACEPVQIGDDADVLMGLSPPVQAALDQGVALVESLVGRLVNEQHQATVLHETWLRRPRAGG
jgi:hydrogenase maturation protease